MNGLMPALRRLARTPRVTLPALALLALGLGACAVVFGVFNAVVEQAAPYPSANHLVVVAMTTSGRPAPDTALSPARARWLEAAASWFSASGDYRLGSEAEAVGPDGRRQFSPAYVSSGLLDALRAEPALGRNFTTADLAPGAAPVAVLGASAWRNLFRSSPSAVGETLRVGGSLYTVVGVLPASFRFIRGNDVQLYFPAPLTPATAGASVTMVGRMRPGVTRGAAVSRLRVLARRAPPEALDQVLGHWSFTAIPLRDFVVQSLGRVLGGLLLALLILQLLVCANVAGLLLAQHEARRPEIATRLALGASRAAIVRQLMTESLLLAGGGCGLGLALATWGVGVARAVMPPGTAPWAVITLSPAVAGFCVGLAILSALAFGVLPAALLARRFPAQAFGAREGLVPARLRLRAHSALVVAQVTGAVVFAAVFGLLLQNLWILTNTDLGFTARGVTSLEFRGAVPPARVAGLVDAARALPGVERAAYCSLWPLTPGLIMTNFGAEQSGGNWVQSPDIEVVGVSPDYFRVMGIPLRAGRGIANSDTPGAPRAAVVSESLAALLWPGQPVVGRRIDLNYPFGAPALARIVGEVPDVRDRSAAAEARPEIYFSAMQMVWGGSPALVVRAGGRRISLAAASVAAHRAVPGLALLGASVLGDAARRSLYLPRCRAVVLGLIAALGCGIAMAGIYALVGYWVARRRRELAIRLALGARPSDAFALVFRAAAGLIAMGACLGVPAGIALARLARSTIPGLPGGGVGVALAACCGVGAMGLVSVMLPARRATSISVPALLRDE